MDVTRDIDAVLRLGDCGDAAFLEDVLEREEEDEELGVDGEDEGPVAVDAPVRRPKRSRALATLEDAWGWDVGPRAAPRPRKKRKEPRATRARPDDDRPASSSERWTA